MANEIEMVTTAGDKFIAANQNLMTASPPGTVKRKSLAVGS